MELFVHLEAKCISLNVSCFDYDGIKLINFESESVTKNVELFPQMFCTKVNESSSDCDEDKMMSILYHVQSHVFYFHWRATQNKVKTSLII